MMNKLAIMGDMLATGDGRIASLTRHGISGAGIAMLAQTGADEKVAQTILEGVIALIGLLLSRKNKS